MQKTRFGSCAFFGIAAVLHCLMHPALALVFPVINVDNASDTDIADSMCTLREAIVAANAHAAYHGCTLSSPYLGGATYIDFALAGNPGDVHTIGIDTALPEITTAVVIDGLSQPGTDCTRWPPGIGIEIANPDTGAYSGLVLGSGSDGSTIRGLAINGFNDSGSNFNAGIVINSAYNRIECNLVGTDVSGTVAAPNLRGIDINSKPGATAHDNVIGSDGTPRPYFARNLLSANRYGQVDIRGVAPNGNRISGNYIGTTVSGRQSLTTAASAEGVSIAGGSLPAYGNVIGWDGVGDPALMRNVISGIANSSAAAVMLPVGAHDNRIAGNYIGTDPGGTFAVPNFVGISIGPNSDVYHNVIGGDGDQPVVSARNVVAGNAWTGIDLSGAVGSHENAVIDNYIGVDARGGSLTNGGPGISLDFSSSRTLVARNWIVGNPTAIRFFAAGSVGGGATATFINNAGAAIAGLPPLDSSGNCVLGETGVGEDAQGATVTATLFARNWWGAATGPNTPGASTADGAVTTTPPLGVPASVCSDVLFQDGFEGAAN